MDRLLIIGSRGYGREVYNWVMDCVSAGLELTVEGFLDDNADALSGFENYPPIISSVEDYTPQEGDVFLCALGDVKYRKLYADMISAKGGRFISIVHPTASLSQNVTIGKGCVIGRFCAISCDVKIGDFVTISAHSVLGHDVCVGNYCTIGALSMLAGGVIVEDGVTLHPKVDIIPHKRIGQNSVVGTGSVVLRNVKPDTTVFGVPAKHI
jgi:sugar O-acyltransferase (sialic acid O-acetyltransferase NeuD family)